MTPHNVPHDVDEWMVVISKSLKAQGVIIYRDGATLGYKDSTAPLTFYKHILCAET